MYIRFMLPCAYCVSLLTWIIFICNEATVPSTSNCTYTDATVHAADADESGVGPAADVERGARRRK